MAPETFLRVLGPKPYKVAYAQPSRRPADGRYGENPNRLYKHTQLQVILKPPPENVQDLYLESLGAIGIDLRQHDLKFEEDNWEAPTLSAWGVGWQVMLDGLEVTQFTYFQQCGGIDLDPISAELTYGLERITAFLQDVDSIYDIVWARNPDSGHVTTYGDVRLAEELQFSVYNFELADVEKAWKHFELYEAECKGLYSFAARLRAAKESQDRNEISLLIESVPSPWSFPQGHYAEAVYDGVRIAAHSAGGSGINTYSSISVNVLWPDGQPDFLGQYSVAELRLANHIVQPARIRQKWQPRPLAAYDLCLKCSHLFNILDARGAISVTERVGVIARVRVLAVGIAKAHVDQQRTHSPEDNESQSVAEKRLKVKKEKTSPVGA